MKRGIYQRVKVEDDLYLHFISGPADSCAFAARADGTRLNLSEERLYMIIKQVMYGNNHTF
jgi:hypothetical protein